MAVLPAAAARLHSLLPVLREVAGIVPGPAAAMAAFAAFAAGFHRAGAIVGKIAGTALATDTPGTRSLLPVCREIPAIAGWFLL